MALETRGGDEHLPHYRLSRALAVAAATIAVCVSLLTIYFLAGSVRQEVDALAAVNSDTTQWTLAQSEVDLLALLTAMQAAAADPEGDLEKVRLRFDIFYSRVHTIDESRQFRQLRQVADAQRSIAALKTFLSGNLAVIDGSDADLRAALPTMIAHLERVRADVREFSLLGVSLFAETSDALRAEVAKVLTRIGFLTFALVASLLVVVLVLTILFRQSSRTVRAAAETRNRLQEVISTSIDGILAVDTDGRIIDYNGAAERIFGYSREEAMGQDMGSLVIPDHLRQAHENGMARYRATGERHVVGKGLLRLEAKRKDGSTFPVEVTISSAMANGKEIFVSYLRDISRRVKDERDLIEARDKAVAGEKAKAELLVVMSHEMRTPLNGLLGTMELMEHTSLDPSQTRYLSAMESSAKLLLHHVNDVLGISSAEAGQLALSPGWLNPRDLLDELVESQRPAIEGRGNRVSFDASTAPERIWVDPIRLRQVILNLLGNANKFTKNGEIFLECVLLNNGKQVEFRVMDTGIGIAEADHERIFEDFRTLDSSFARHAEGTGLGLGIARRLVMAMGGKIGLESELGEGSLFWIRLPVGESGSDHPTEKMAEAETLPPREPEAKQDALRVLLVEDNGINRLVARDMLEKAGHAVTEAVDGRDGVEKSRIERFDVVLMDISMPELDGMAATALIRETGNPNRDTPVIALTAHALPQHLERFRAAGMSDTLTKPLTMDAVNRTLRRLGMQQAGAAVPSPTFEAIGKLVEQLGAESAGTLLEQFIAETEEMFEQLRRDPSDAEERNRQADLVHKSAGLTSLFGIDEMTKALRQAEFILRDGDPGSIPSTVADLVEIWTRTQGTLADARRKHL